MKLSLQAAFHRAEELLPKLLQEHKLWTGAVIECGGQKIERVDRKLPGAEKYTIMLMRRSLLTRAPRGFAPAFASVRRVLQGRLGVHIFFDCFETPRGTRGAPHLAYTLLPGCVDICRRGTKREHRLQAKDGPVLTVSVFRGTPSDEERMAPLTPEKVDEIIELVKVSYLV